MTATPIKTQRLTLIAADAALARADAEDELARLLPARVPANWPPDEYGDARGLFARTLEAHPDLQGWLVWYVIRTEDNILIGSGGFRGRPDAQGIVEIGYSLLEQFFGNGYATEAVGAMIRHAFSDEKTRQVIAMIRRDNPASIRVLEKNGFAIMGPGDEPDTLDLQLARTPAFAADDTE